MSTLTAEAGEPLFPPPVEETCALSLRTDELPPLDEVAALAVGRAPIEIVLLSELDFGASAAGLVELALIEAAASFIAEIESDRW